MPTSANISFLGLKISRHLRIKDIPIKIILGIGLSIVPLLSNYHNIIKGTTPEISGAVYRIRWSDLLGV